MEQIIATHTVKPSSLTPLQLKTHRFSFIDEISPQMYIPLIFFYHNLQSQQHTQISLRLRQSLSEILTIFYPLAGKVNGNSSIDCNDSGAEMVEARIHAPLQHFTQDPDVEELRRLLPTGTCPQEEDDRLLLVKINFFDCGGVAVGINFSHKFGDMSSLTMVLNSWAAACRGEASRIISPSFDLVLHFPPIGVPNISVEIEKIVTRRLVFNSEKLQKIKKRFASEKVKDPSTVEALSAFIWQTAIQVHKAKSSSSSSSSFRLMHAVNLRPRIVPPIPDHAIGNCAVPTTAMVSWEEDERERENESGVYVSSVRAAIRGIDNEYIKNNVMEDGMKLLRDLGPIKDDCELGMLGISSWWRFPVYDVDFGWGKPVWVCTTTLPCLNAVTLMSTPSGDGIEAWINTLDDEFFMMLQVNCKNLDNFHME